MLVNRTKWSVKFGLVITFLASTVFAQTSDTPAVTDDNASLSFAKTSQLTLSEQERQVGNYNRKMKSVQASVAIKANEAKKDSDIIKLNCVVDKKTKIDANVQVGDDVDKAFKTPTVRNDTGQRNFQFSKITIAHQNTVVLGSEANACIGEDLAYVGKTQSTTEEDESITKSDTTKTKSDYDDTGAPTRGTSSTPVR